jgi:hypothetical protein
VSETPPQSRLLFRRLKTVFGCPEPSVHQYWDEDHKSHVDVLTCLDSPVAGVTSYATIGLSTVPLQKGGEPLRLGVELVGACSTRFSQFANVLATAAFCVINTGWFVAPGVVFPDIVKMYGVSSTLCDLYFVPPFLWDGKLVTIHLQEIDIAWLLAVPISRAEADVAATHGPQVLEQLLEDNRVDMFDLERRSVV